MQPATQFIRVLGGFENWQSKDQLDCQVISGSEPIICFALTTKNLRGREVIANQQLRIKLKKVHGTKTDYEQTDEEIENYLND